jgi:hypothetical protein
MILSNFREWLVFNEDASVNMGRWLEALYKYAKPEEKGVLEGLERAGILVDDPAGGKALRDNFRNVISPVLVRKRKENMNWFAFALGYLSVKRFLPEDLEIALDAAEAMKASGEIPAAEIGQRGWMMTGVSMLERVPAYMRSQNALSRRESIRMKKEGGINKEDSRLIKRVAVSGDMELFYVQAVSDEDLEARHRILCKYGANTAWCTANATGTHHELYKSYGIYILHRGGAPKYQFTACSDLPDKSDYPDDGEEGENSWPGQFMDVDDQPVKSLTPEEEKFIRKNGDAVCYGLVSDGFDSLEDFMSAPDQKVQAVSGKTVGEVISMAGNRAAEVMGRMGGSALMRLDVLGAEKIVSSESFGPEIAGSILDGIRAAFGKDVVKFASAASSSSRGSAGLERLMVRSIMASTNPWTGMSNMIAFMNPKVITDMFSGSKALGDEVLLKLASALEKPTLGQIAAMVSCADDTDGILELLGSKMEEMFAPTRAASDTMNGIFDKLKGRGDKYLQIFSDFLERRAGSLPPIASRWAVLFSRDREATAKRMLAKIKDDERVREIFSTGELGHLMDDSHVGQISRKRPGVAKDYSGGFNYAPAGGIVSIANKHFDRLGEKDKSLKRLLLNSDDVDGSEVMAAVLHAAKPGEFVDSLPEDVIGMIGDEHLVDALKKAIKDCEGIPGRAGLHLSGCHLGKPVVELLKRMKRHFPMESLSLMEKGDERDLLIIRNLADSSAEEVSRAMDFAEDKKKVAEKVMELRGEKMTPKEIFSILAYTKDKKFLDAFGDRINSLDAPYESTTTISGLVWPAAEGDLMDRLMSGNLGDEMKSEILKRYKKRFGLKAIDGMIINSQDQKAMVQRIAGLIRGLDGEEYTKLQKMMRTNHYYGAKANEGTLAAVDEVRHGPLEVGDKVKLFSGGDFKRGGNSTWIKGSPVFRVVGVEGNSVEVSPTEPAESDNFRNSKVGVDEVLKASKDVFYR